MNLLVLSSMSSWSILGHLKFLEKEKDSVKKINWISHACHECFLGFNGKVGKIIWYFSHPCALFLNCFNVNTNKLLLKVFCVLGALSRALLLAHIFFFSDRKFK